MKKTPRPTMASVAKLAGVSLMTVSRSLRSHPSIPPKTRQRVLRAAAKLGYRPDPAVSQLMARLRASRIQAPETIAWLTSHQERTGWRGTPSSDAIFRGAVARAQQLGYKLEEHWLGDTDMIGRRMSDILRHRGIRGLVVAPLERPGAPIDFEWQYFAAATCGYSLTQPNLHRACSHQFHAMQVAWRSLASRGYRRIGLALSLQGDTRVDGVWRAAFLLHQAELPAAQRVPVLLTADWNADTLARWFERHRPDAIISSTDALHFLSAQGLHSPRHFGFVGFNHADSGDAASIDHHMPELGAAAIDLVIEQLHSHQYGVPKVPKVVMVECTLHPGRTIAG